MQNCFCPLLKRGLLYKERTCSQREQILSLLSRPLFRRGWACSEAIRKAQKLSRLAEMVKKYTKYIYSPKVTENIQIEPDLKFKIVDPCSVHDVLMKEKRICENQNKYLNLCHFQKGSYLLFTLFKNVS